MERCGRNVLWGAQLLAVGPDGAVLGAGRREGEDTVGCFFLEIYFLRGWGPLPAAKPPTARVAAQPLAHEDSALTGWAAALQAVGTRVRGLSACGFFGGFSS